MLRIFSASCILLMFTVCQGCGDKNEGRCNLTGTITLNGTPIEEGYIEFIPENPAAGKAVVGGQALITNGAYSIVNEQGLLPGKYKVRIDSQRMVDKKSGNYIPGKDKPDDFTSYTIKNLIPEKYNTKSELVYTVENVKKATFDYNVITK